MLFCVTDVDDWHKSHNDDVRLMTSEWLQHLHPLIGGNSPFLSHGVARSSHSSAWPGFSDYLLL